MVFEVKLPRLGWDMEEGALAEWLKNDGEFVNSGEALFSVEGDKAVQEIEALESGYLKVLPTGPQPGERVAVGTLLAYLVPKEEINTFSMPVIEKKEGREPQGEPAGIPVETIPSQGRDSQLDTAKQTTSRVFISPLAKRMAENWGLDWRIIKGTGMNGRISARDIEREKMQKSREYLSGVDIVQGDDVSTHAILPPTRIPMAGIHKKIADHMAYSAHTAAPVTLTMEVDATELVGLRKVIKSDESLRNLPIPSYNDIFAKICAQALLEHPMVNARIEGDEIIQSSSIHIGIAVDTERGLLVPVVKDVQSKTLRQIASESTGLVQKSRSGNIPYEDLQGATFTITNLGMFEIDSFTPIIDLPQCAILGVGRIAPKQVVIDFENEKVALRQCVFLSLTFDHRLIDGAQAARFLQRVKQFIERPILWLAG